MIIDSYSSGQKDYHNNEHITYASNYPALKSDTLWQLKFMVTVQVWVVNTLQEFNLKNRVCFRLRLSWTPIPPSNGLIEKIEEMGSQLLEGV